MADLHNQVERISALEELETSLMTEQDMEGLASILAQRETAILEFMAAGPGEQVDIFRDKLVQMQVANTRLRNKALLLHQTLKEELLKLRSETRRLDAYSGGGMVTSLPPQFLSRHS